MIGKLYAESLRILTEKMSRQGMPDDVPRTWILTRRDRALAPKVQRKYIEVPVNSGNAGCQRRETLVLYL